MEERAFAIMEDREPLDALARASAVLVTRKSASAAGAERAAAQLRRAAGGVPVGIAALSLDALREVGAMVAREVLGDRWADEMLGER